MLSLSWTKHASVSREKSGIPCTRVSEYTPERKDETSMSSKIYRPYSMAKGVCPGVEPFFTEFCDAPCLVTILTLV